MIRSINRYLLLTLLIWGGCANTTEKDIVIKHVMKLEKNAMGDNSGEVNDYSVSEVISTEWLKSKLYIIKTNPYVPHFNKFMIAIDSLENIIEIFNPYGETNLSNDLTKIMNHNIFLRDFSDISPLLHIHQSYYTSVYGSSSIFFNESDFPDSLKEILQPFILRKDKEKVVVGFNFIIETARGDFNVYRDSIIVTHSGMEIYQTNLTNNKIMIL